MIRLAAWATALTIAAGVCATAAAAMTPAGTYNYRIQHPRYGDVGTYTNRITSRDDVVRVETSVRIAVKLAFVTVYRLDADRTEEWRDGRLVAYDGTTAKNGKTTRVGARAEGGQLVIQGPKGMTTAPAELWPANPWSPDVVKAPVIMGTATGRLYRPTVTGGEEEPVTVGGRTVPARHYRILTGEANDVWFDAEGRLVRFTTVEDDQVITLTLQ